MTQFPLREEVRINIFFDFRDTRALTPNTSARIFNALTIATANAANAFCDLHFRDRVKRNFDTVRSADTQIIQAVIALPRGFRVAKHDADILAVTGQTLHFETVEGLAHLLGDALQGDAQRLGARFHCEADFASRTFQAVPGARHVGIAFNMFFQIENGGRQVRFIRGGDGVVKPTALTRAPFGKAILHAEGIRDRPDIFFQLIGNIFGADATTLICGGKAQIGFNTTAFGNRPGLVDNRAFNPKISHSIGIQTLNPLIDLGAGLIDALKGRAFREARIDADHVAFDFWDKRRRRDPGDEEGEGHAEHTNEGRQRHITPANEHGHKRTELVLCERDQAFRNRILQT